MSWQLWFLRLSGWPVFLTVIAAVAVFMVVASVVLTRISNRSVLQNFVLVILSIAVLGLVLLVALAFLSRASLRAG